MLSLVWSLSDPQKIVTFDFYLFFKLINKFMYFNWLLMRCICWFFCVKLVEYGFSRTIAKRFITDNDEDVVRDALKSVNVQMDRGRVKNPKAMVQMAIKEKWKPEVYKARKYLN